MSPDAVDDYEEEKFFTNVSYDAFTKKNNIEILGEEMYINNNQHRVDIVVPDDMRITSEIMTVFEMTRVTSERAKQIEEGSQIFCDVGTETNLIKIAEMEIEKKCCPMKIERFLTKNIKEVWRVSELIAPFK